MLVLLKALRRPATRNLFSFALHSGVFQTSLAWKLLVCVAPVYSQRICFGKFCSIFGLSSKRSEVERKNMNSTSTRLADISCRLTLRHILMPAALLPPQEGNDQPAVLC